MANHPLSLTVVASRATSSWRSSAASLLTSILVHGVAITALILVPLLATSSMPTPASAYRLPEYIAVKVTPPYEAPEGPKPPSTSAPESPTPPSISTELFAPAEVANTIADPPEFYGGGLGVEGGLPFSDIMPLEAPQSTPPPVEPTQPVVIGGELKPPRKIHDVTPIYPAIARQARKEGIVTLRAIIDAQGNVVNLSVVKSVALLDEAAMNAVSQWKHEPTLLNGQAVPIVMTVRIGFKLS